ncbi:hypothetical protein CD790_12410 [Streptomyces sp. SAJ15]|nr:hypothetical protein CD790_12410 [Streptomyces sp. SAJ15]
MRTATAAAALLLSTGGLAGCGSGAGSGGSGGVLAAPSQTPSATRAAAPARTSDRLPGLGPHTLAKVPEEARQAVVVTGKGADSSDSTVVLYERTADGWRAAGPTWPAHNALRGWTDDHRAGDLRSPRGVFTLTDAGGRLPDPGARLPYHRSAAFVVNGTGFRGEPLAGSFDYVVAIDYNRVRGTSPMDWSRPLGAAKGGGIWIHVDHGGPTQGCVSLIKPHMRALLRALDPARDPVVVMGDAAALAR